MFRYVKKNSRWILRCFFLAAPGPHSLPSQAEHTLRFIMESMSIISVKDIETAIDKLTPQEYDELRQWFDQYNRPQPIDTQLKADLDAGRIDERIKRALSDHSA